MDMIVISSDLDTKISQIVPDQKHHSPCNITHTINELFPTKESIETISDVVKNIKDQIDQLNIQSRNLIFKKSKQQNPELFLQLQEDGTRVLNTIQTIQKKVKESKELIMEMTSDITHLDETKRNIHTSIQVLKRIHITVHGLEYLKGLLNQKHYSQIKMVLKTIQEISKPLEIVQNVQQIKSILERKSGLELLLKKTIYLDFEGSFHSGTMNQQKEMLYDSCLVLELLEPLGKNQLIRWYMELQLLDYRTIFQKNPELAGIKDISRRFAWLKRMLKHFDDQHSCLFPVHWKVDECVTIQFCQETKRDLMEQMNKNEKESMFDTMAMLQAIHSSIDFEQKLKSRFVKEVDDHLKWDRIVTSGFDSFLWHYVDVQDQTLLQKFEEYKVGLGEIDDGIYQSSLDLFLFYRQTLGNCAQLSIGKPFLDLMKMYQKWLIKYIDVMNIFLKQERKNPIETDFIGICCIINTSDYCGTTTVQLEEKMMETISNEFKQVVTFQTETEMFLQCTCNAIQSLIKLVETNLDVSLQQMTRTSWNQIVSVGDQSNYITAMGHSLSQMIPLIRQHIGNQKYFRSFCDKFVE